MSIYDQIAEMLFRAEALPGSRIYLDKVKMRELEAWISAQPSLAHMSFSDFSFNGMKVVLSSKPGMSIRRYKTLPQLHDRQWVTPIRRGYVIECCRCGLRHRMDFRVRKGVLQFRATRARK